MERIFDLHNHFVLKFQEIQYGYIDGIDYMLKRCKTANECFKGLIKLRNLKDTYENQLLQAKDHLDAVKEIQVCFRCFDKPEGECHDCD